MDLTVELLRHGYDALPRLRARAGDPDAFPVRMLGQHAVVVQGEEGARLFYDTQRMVRHGAAPAPLANLLFGSGAVHALDGEQHRQRKLMFVQVLRGERVLELCDLVATRLASTLDADARRSGALFDPMARAYGGAILEWSGVGAATVDADGLSRELADIVDGFGLRPGAYARGWRARVRANRWARSVVADARAGGRRPAEGTMLRAVSSGPGAGLPVHVAAVELLNVLRPTVAVAWLGAFAALFLAQHPEHGARLLEDSAFRVAFAHEVRRHAPFVPALAARAAVPVDHRGQHLDPGQRLVLDVPATNHHPASWLDPRAFRPERFLEDPLGEFRFVPQGGGRAETGHRCPGEDVTIALLTVTLDHLARTSFTLPDARVDRRRIPTLPGGA